MISLKIETVFVNTEEGFEATQLSRYRFLASFLQSYVLKLKDTSQSNLRKSSYEAGSLPPFGI